MNNLMSIRTNILYSKKEDGSFQRYQELIFLVDKPKYNYSNAGEIIRERSLEEMRFVVSDNSFEQMIKLLETLKNADEKDLV